PRAGHRRAVDDLDHGWRVRAGRIAERSLARLPGLDLCRVADGGLAVPAHLRPATRVASLDRPDGTPDGARAAVGGRRYDRVGYPPARRLHPRPVRGTRSRRNLLHRAAGREPAAEAQDQLRADPG